MKPQFAAVLLAFAFSLAGCGGGGGARSTAAASIYSNRMHSRFYKAWVQPVSVSSKRAKISVPVDVEIDARGKVRSFVIARPARDSAVNDSINAVAQRVRNVAPPPGAKAGESFKLRIFFELDVR